MSIAGDDLNLWFLIVWMEVNFYISQFLIFFKLYWLFILLIIFEYKDIVIHVLFSIQGMYSSDFAYYMLIL